MPPEPFGVVLAGGAYDRAHAGLMLAAGAGAMGRPVVVFAMGLGCLALMRDWAGMDGADRDAGVQASGVAGLDALRDAVREMGGRLIACESGLALTGLQAAALADGVEVAGVTAFLGTVGAGQVVTV